jgi:hypothetical protein
MTEAARTFSVARTHACPTLMGAAGAGAVPGRRELQDSEPFSFHALT